MTIWPDESTLFGQLYGNVKASQLVFKYETTTHIQAFKWLFHGYLLICGPLWKAVLEIGNSLSLCYLTDLSKCTAMEKKLCVFHWQQICSTLCGAVIHKEILCSLPCFLSRLLQENFQEKWYGKKSGWHDSRTCSRGWRCSRNPMGRQADTYTEALLFHWDGMSVL